MNKITLLVLVSVFSLGSYSQEQECAEKLVQNLTSKIKPFESKDLVPYYSERDEKWGFLHKDTKNRVTKPIFRKPVLFNPWLSSEYTFETKGKEDGCYIILKGSKDKYEVRYASSSDYGISSEISYHSNGGSATGDRSKINDDIPGFEVDEDGYVTAFNSRFFDYGNDKARIEAFAIKFKEKYYAVVSKHENYVTTYSIIDQDGNVIEGLDNMNDRPLYEYTFATQNDLWFLVRMEKTRAGYTFRSINQNQFMGKFKRPYIDTIFPKTIGYAVLRTENGDGVLDLTTMEWKIKPISENVFYDLHYATQEILLERSYPPEPENIVPEIPIEKILENRKKANIYVRDSKNQFLDLELNPYLVNN